MGVSAADISDSGVSSSRPRMWAARLASWSSSAVSYRFLKTFSKCQSCHGESAQVQTHEQKPLGAVGDSRGRKLVWDEKLLRCRRERGEKQRQSAPSGSADEDGLAGGVEGGNFITTAFDLCDFAWSSRTADYSSSIAALTESVWPFLLAANYTHTTDERRTAPKPKIKRSAALAVAVTPNRSVLVEFPRLSLRTNPAMKMCVCRSG